MTTSTFPCLPRCPAGQRTTCSRVGVAVIVAACVVVPAVAGAFTAASVRDWYPMLAKPDWTPPAWVFGPVWTVLYAMMAVSASLVWLHRDETEPCGPLGFFAVQLAANLLWSVLFFGLRSPWLGFLDILLLWAAVGMTVVTFFQVRRLAGWLLVPYWLWVSFAACLNGAIALMGS